MKGICFNEHEAKALMHGRLSKILRPIARVASLAIRGPITEFEPSTTQGYDWQFRGQHMRWKHVTTNRLLELCQFVVGDESYYVKETWQAWRGGGESDEWDIAVEPLPHDAFEYKAGPTESIGPWRSPACMPAFVARFSIEIVSIAPAKLATLNDDDACHFGHDYADYDFGDSDMGLVDVMEEDWNKRYGMKHPWSISWAWSIEIRKVNS